MWLGESFHAEFLQRIFNLSSAFIAILDFASRNENKERNPLKWSSSGQISVLAVLASAAAFVSDVKILGLGQ